MALPNELPVYKSTYDLLLEIFVFVKDFGKEYKYTVGESLKKETIELLTLIFRANASQDKEKVLAETMSIPEEDISIKATTNEEMGYVGRREGGNAYAVALIYKK